MLRPRAFVPQVARRQGPHHGGEHLAIAAAAGLGREATAVFATVLAYVLLALLLKLERRVEQASDSRR